jgi:tetratricopeptide (TPR) repeat protein
MDSTLHFEARTSVRFAAAWLAAGCAGGLALLVLGGAVPAARAQDRQVQARLVELGRMDRQVAREVARAVDRKLRENADRGGDSFDRVRTAVASALFPDGPGATPEDRRRRIGATLRTMRRGLDVSILERLFAPADGASALCALDFGLDINACDALVSAASRQQAPVPYFAPDDGRALRATLEGAGASRRDAEAAVAALRAVMLGVPGSLTDDARGRAMLALLEGCPGGLSSRESQLRAWHVGPTEGMVRCIVERVGGRRSKPEVAAALGEQLGVPEAGARALVAWALPNAPEQPVAAAAQPAQPAQPAIAMPPPGTPPAQVLAAAERADRAGRLAEAAAYYAWVTRADPSNGPAFASLGAVLLRQGDGAGAARALDEAIRRLPRTAPPPLAASLFAQLGQAHERAGDPSRARAAYQQALGIDRTQREAIAGMQRLAGPPGPGAAPPASPTMATGSSSTFSPGTQPGLGPPAGPGRPADQPRTASGGMGGSPQMAMPPDAYVSGPGGRPGMGLGAPPGGPGGQPGMGGGPPPGGPGGQPGMGGGPPPGGPGGPPPPETPLQVAQRAFAAERAGNLREAAQLYERVTQLDPSNGPAFASLGAVRLRLEDGAGAAAALDQAIARLPRSASPALAASLFFQLGQAHEKAQARDRALEAYRRAAQIDRNHREAIAAVERLTPPPDVPSRDQILATMRPLQNAIAGCFPGRSGVVKFSVTTRGSDGAVVEVSLSGGDFQAEVAGTPDEECALHLLRAATFPRFARETLTFEYPFRL